MKKNIKILMLCLAVFMALTGCAKVESAITINSNGSAKYTESFTLDKVKTDELLKKLGFTDTKKALKEFLTDDQDDMHLENYKVVTIDGKQYYKSTGTEILKANKVNSFIGNGKDSYASKDTIYMNNIWDKADLNDFKELELIGYDISSLVNATYTVELPKAIVSTNGVIDKTNPKRATFNIDLNKGVTIFATSSKNMSINKVKAKIKASNKVDKPKIKSLKIKNIKNNKGTINLKLKKQKSNIEYVITYSTSKKKLVNVVSFYKESLMLGDTIFGSNSKCTKKNNVTIKGLKKDKKYYVSVFAIKKNIAGKYSSSKTAKKSITIK